MQKGSMSGEKVRALALQRAIDALGGAIALCAHLDVKPEELMRWISGEAEVPEATFLRLVDLICEVRPIPDPVAVLKKARELAGGVSFLAQHIGLSAEQLDLYLHAQAPVPEAVVRRVVDFLNDVSHPGYVPPGFPPNWREGDSA